MKKFIAILSLAVMALCLCSCAAKTKETENAEDVGMIPADTQQDDSQEDDSQSEEVLPSEEPSEEPTEEASESIALPSDSEVDDMIAAYMEYEAYSSYNTPELDYGQQASDDPNTIEYNYVLVVQEGMSTWDEWVAYLSNIFTGEALEDAQKEGAGEQFLKHDGKLYAAVAGMGWPYTNEYVIASMEETGEDTVTLEFWREIDPNFTSQPGVREFLITVLDFQYTEDGWRISHTETRDSTPDDTNPNLDGYSPNFNW